MTSFVAWRPPQVLRVIDLSDLVVEEALMTAHNRLLRHLRGAVGPTRRLVLGSTLVAALAVPSAVLGLAGAGARADVPAISGEATYRALPELPVAGPGLGRDSLEAAAITLADALRAVPVDEAAHDVCPVDDLAVRWTPPGSDSRHGAFIKPLGPPPGSATPSVNGIVVCTSSSYAFMGFHAGAARGAARWDIEAVPFVEEEEHPAGIGVREAGEPAGHDHDEVVAGVSAGEPDRHGHDDVVGAGRGPVLDLTTVGFGAAIEGYAAHEPQRTCSATVKPGMAALRDLLLGRYAGSRNLGIVRGCSIGGQSEHKEGRAFDWGVLVNRPAERAAAENLIASVLATDEHGNRHALARRMGIMYMIWDGRIWSASRASSGWRPYSGPSPHTDHVHISLSWDGAMARTSFWAGRVDPSAALGALPMSGDLASGRGVGPAPAVTPVKSVLADPARERSGPRPADQRPVRENERIDGSRWGDGGAAEARDAARRAEERRLAEEARRAADEANRAAEEARRRAEEAHRAEHARRAEEAHRREHARAEQARQEQRSRPAPSKGAKQTAAPSSPATGGAKPARQTAEPESVKSPGPRTDQGGGPSGGKGGGGGRPGGKGDAGGAGRGGGGGRGGKG